jgi:Domain of unknown function (DUF4112)
MHRSVVRFWQREAPVAAPPSILTLNQQRALQHARRVARLLDSQWGIGPLRFGLASLADLVPVIGDAFSLVVSLYQLGVARQLGVPRRRRLRMGVNVALDALLGGVPLLGDAATTLFKAHLRNQRILDAAVAADAGETARPAPRAA